MSDIWRAAQWWDEWQLRILVLSSLSLQWFLVLVVPLRNYTIQRWLRACIWLACICADVLAIYALATLLYRQAAGRWISSFDDYYSRAQQGRSLTLEALWAPGFTIPVRKKFRSPAINTKFRKYRKYRFKFK